MRYIRYLRRKRKALLKQLNKQELQERKQARSISKEQLKRDLFEDRKREQREKEIRTVELESVKEKFLRDVEEYRPKLNTLRAQQKTEQEQQKEFQKMRRKRLMRFYARNRSRGFKRWLLSINRRNLRKRIAHYKSQKQARKNFYSIAANSTSLFLLSYLFVYLFSLLVTSISATFFEYSSIIYYYDIYFNIRGDQWHHDAVKVIYSSGPIACLFVGTILLIIFSYIREDKGLYKMFFFWGFLHSYTMFFGGVLVGTMFGSGFGHAINWSYILDTGKMVYSIIAIAIFILIGVLSSKSFLISANSYYNNLTGNARGMFVAAQIVIPFLLGNILMFLFRMPRLKMYFIFVGITMILVILPTWISTRFYPNMYFHEDPVRVRPSWKLIALAAIVYAILRVLLEIGIPVDFT